MAWLRIDDRVRTHPKVVMAGPEAAWVWFCGICYCREHLTDGVIPKGMLASLAPGVSMSAVRRLADKLVEVRLWHRLESGDFEIHDFSDWNPTREEVEANRTWDRRRKELYADPDLVSFIRRRDSDSCRYCGVAVNWKDRRGPSGGQFDHVIPRGDNTPENVVVACRKCNTAKGGRTPSDARMELIELNPNQSGTSSESNTRTSSASCVDAIAGGLGLGTGSDSDPQSSSVTKESSTAGFDAFWQAYPKKKSKEDAVRAWRKLKPDADLQAHILEAIREQSFTPDWLKDGGQFIPYPASWLNGRRWLDEVSQQPQISERNARSMGAIFGTN